MYVGKYGYYTHYQEPGLGLLQLGVRYYDPTTRRFTQKDPARDGLNWYAYAGDRPTVGGDPDGREWMFMPLPDEWVGQRGRRSGRAYAGIVEPTSSSRFPTVSAEPWTWGSPGETRQKMETQ